jgi:hypothetical protein
MRLNHEDGRIDINYRFPDGLDHILTKLCLGAVHPRGVKKYELGIALRVYAGYPVACGLRLGADYGKLFAEHSIEQRGFSHIRAADYCYKSRMCYIHLKRHFSVR